MSEDSVPLQSAADAAAAESDHKLNSWMATVLNVIDKLRDRKARPDVEHIFIMASRQQQQQQQQTQQQESSIGGCELTRDAVSSILQRLVEQRQVMRVEYKGSVSYRNASSWHRRKELASGRNSPATSQRVLTAAQDLPDGTSFTAQLLHSRMMTQQQQIQADDEQSMMSAADLAEALEREAAAGRLFRVGPSRYQLDLDGSKRDAALRRRKERLQLAKGRRAAAAAAAAAVAANPASKVVIVDLDIEQAIADGSRRSNKDSSHREADDESEFLPPPSKRGSAHDLRLSGNHRRRRRRGGNQNPKVPPSASSASTSSSSIDAGVSISVGVGASADVCDFCQSPPAANRMGVPERMLRCRDCAHKAHPSCMQYSPELAQRACQSPWQCSECKTCCVCSGSGDPELMLICDACDKGYHVSCHRPRVTQRPASDAKWVCSRCRDEEKAATDATHDGSDPVQQQPQKPQTGDASQWSIAQVRCWLQNEGFPLAAQAFVEQEIDGASLMLMKRMDVLTGLGLKLGPAVKVFEKISRLQCRCRTLLQVKHSASGASARY